MCSCHGFLCKESAGQPTQTSYKIIRPGKNRDGYWKNSDLVKQVEECIPLFEAFHNPNEYQLLFAFDNSQNHHAKPPDALLVNKLKLNDHAPSEKRPKLFRPTTFIDSATGEVKDQNILRDDGWVKGMRTILQERGLWDRVAGKKIMRCQACKDTPKEPDDPIINCCCHRLLSVQPDFADSQEWLQEVITEAGHLIIFFPKFHCELNYIEMVWAYIKREIKSDCKYSLEEMHRQLKEQLDSIPLEYVRKIERRCFRFMHGYQLGMQGPMLDYAMRSYTSHRMFPSEFVVQEFEAIYAQYRSTNPVKIERQYNVLDES